METLEQFVKYRIAPPKALTQLYEQYVAALSAIEQQENAKKEAKLMNVLDLWKRRSNFFMDGSYLYNFFFFGANWLSPNAVEWWNTDFSANESWQPELLHFFHSDALLKLGNSDPLNPSFWREIQGHLNNEFVMTISYFSSFICTDKKIFEIKNKLLQKESKRRQELEKAAKAISLIKTWSQRLRITA